MQLEGPLTLSVGHAHGSKAHDRAIVTDRPAEMSGTESPEFYASVGGKWACSVIQLHAEGELSPLIVFSTATELRFTLLEFRQLYNPS